VSISGVCPCAPRPGEEMQAGGKDAAQGVLSLHPLSPRKETPKYSIMQGKPLNTALCNWLSLADG